MGKIWRLNWCPKLRGTLLSLLLVLSARTGLSQDPLPKLIRDTQPSVVTIYGYTGSRRLLGTGSGFFVDDSGQLVTNCHVLEGVFHAEVKTHVGVTYAVRAVIAEDKEADLAKLQVEIPKGLVKPLRISKSPPEIGERVIVIGSPLGYEQTVSDGIVSGARDVEGYGRMIQISAPVSPGSSGSPVINLSGEVIGVASSQVEGGQNLNFAIPAARISSLQASANTDGKLGKKPLHLRPLDTDYAEGMKFLRGEDYEDALTCLLKAVERNPSHAYAWMRAGVCYLELGEYQESVKACREAVRIRPELYLGHYTMGKAHYRLGVLKEAVSAFKRAIEISPDSSRAHGELGLSYKGLGRLAEAAQAFKQAVRLKPDDASTHAILAGIYGDLKLYDDSIKAYEQAIRLEPNNPHFYSCLGSTHFRLGTYDQAVEVWKQAARLYPKDRDIHYLLGLAYLQLDDRGSALEEYKVLKALDRAKAGELFKHIYP